MTSWIKKNKETLKREGFQIFDDSYFKKCTDFLKYGGIGKSIFGSLENIFNYLTCPIFHFDNLVLDILKQFIKRSHRIPCPESFTNTIKENFPGNELPLSGTTIPGSDPYIPEINSTLALPSVDITDSNPVISNTVRYFFEDHSDWITTDAVKENVLIYYLNSFNSAQKNKDFTSEELANFNNEFNNSLYDKDIINLLLTLKNQSKLGVPVESPESSSNPNDSINNNSKKNNLCASVNDSDIINDANIIKKELYTLLLVPIILFVTYNFYYIFIHNNIYGNPEVYLTNIKKKYYDTFYEFTIPFTTKKVFLKEFKEYMDYFFLFIWKPYNSLFSTITMFYNFRNYSFIQDYIFFIFLFLFLLSYLFIYFYGTTIYELIEYTFTFKQKTSNSLVSTILVIVEYAILFFWGIWAVKKVLSTGKDMMSCPSYFGILFMIFGCIMLIIFRYIISKISKNIAMLICLFYMVFYLLFAMKFCSTRGSIYDAIANINKSIIDKLKINESSLKMIDYLKLFSKVGYNCIIEIASLLIVILSLANHGKFQIPTVQFWYFMINILLIFIFGIFIGKEIFSTGQYVFDILNGGGADEPPVASEPSLANEPPPPATNSVPLEKKSYFSQAKDMVKDNKFSILEGALSAPKALKGAMEMFT